MAGRLWFHNLADEKSITQGGRCFKEKFQKNKVFFRGPFSDVFYKRKDANLTLRASWRMPEQTPETEDGVGWVWTEIPGDTEQQRTRDDLPLPLPLPVSRPGKVRSASYRQIGSPPDIDC